MATQNIQLHQGTVNMTPEIMKHCYLLTSLATKFYISLITKLYTSLATKLYTSLVTKLYT